MRILIIRHGDPDYENDTLTEKGHREAKLLAEKLVQEKIDYFYSSPLGRAIETASYTAKAQGLEIETLDFMREVNWQSANGEPIPCDGHPWNLMAQA